ncbi:MAG: hypothetical protein A2942_02795 [Candidatus Lloydbacteria bacterium RIFCSPLOWO2_01_FULL_50_20]|uniref:Uncharacterized protein n=1 Tax=Candidatus Lloydbacteria bacterium RIFCSPLOWO2_01_FULL_50_20 TaxID=1798665 RepID=A0A1G2DLI4_9BACT|nr:MAG: hypothetical protein A2942_02795 [Candidatus Lloydbacteria bacterium RIFCSPLOWO2_01_FULL_50_20]
MKPRKNKLNHRAFKTAKEALSKAFPQGGIKKAFYIADFKNTKSLPSSMRSVGISAVFEDADGGLNMRIYRPSGKTDPIYDVDETRKVDGEVAHQPAKKEIENHHINHEVPDDIMARNNLTVEFVDDGKGGLRPNTQADGTVKAFINFEDPIEVMKKEMLKKRGLSGESTVG